MTDKCDVSVKGEKERIYINQVSDILEKNNN